jgi:uncharacterized membrane protein
MEADWANADYVVSAILMLRRVIAALRYAVREEDFLNVFSAGIGLLISGTLAYALGEDWNVVDALYFAVSTLTTTSIADRTSCSTTPG